MHGIKYFVLAAAVAGMLFTATAPKSQAQISVNIGIAPDCPYGYYDYAPYSCVPNGYYGPEWFNGGIFIGAGPWFHSSNEFHGNVNNKLDPQHGYRGATPKVGDKPAAQRQSPKQFKGNEVRDGRGHTAAAKR
jgi:hypothetical protein